MAIFCEYGLWYNGMVWYLYVYAFVVGWYFYASVTVWFFYAIVITVQYRYSTIVAGLMDCLVYYGGIVLCLAGASFLDANSILLLVINLEIIDDTILPSHIMTTAA